MRVTIIDNIFFRYSELSSIVTKLFYRQKANYGNYDYIVQLKLITFASNTIWDKKQLRQLRLLRKPVEIYKFGLNTG